MANERLEVLKTYKIYIGGQFPRTESGRYYSPVNANGDKLANMCLSSRKDFRDAVTVARGALSGWAGRAPFNRSQILYRMAEMLEGRKAQFADELMRQDASAEAAMLEVHTAIDRLIYYAGWADKYQQIFSSVNPVSGPHFNFSVTEPVGVVAMIAPEESGLLGLVSLIAPVITGGNTCVVLASGSRPLCAVSFAEVLNSSDLPGGVVNILTGKVSQLYPQFTDHMDVNATIYCGTDSGITEEMRKRSAGNLKRAHFYPDMDWSSQEGESPYLILDLQEVKTTWHPVEQIAGAGAGY